MTTAVIIIVSVLLFLSVVLIHEFGHFITAKLFGVKVNEFSIGMGPALFSKQGKETKYSIRLLPIGGYCAMEGEDEESDDARAFCNIKPWKKFIVVSAGAIFNIILGLIFMFIVLAPGNSADPNASENLVGTTEIWGYNVTDSAAEASGLLAGDKVLSVDGYKVLCSSDIYYGIAFANKTDMTFEVLRNGEKKNIDVHFSTNQRMSPALLSGTDISASDKELTDGTLRDGESLIIDFVIVGKQKTLGKIIKSTFTETVSMCRVVYVSFFKLITGQFKMTDMSGPVGIVSYIGQAAEAGITEGADFWANVWSALLNIFQIMALITVNLGIFNLMPFPALDGGRLIFIIIEWIIGRPVNPKYESLIHAIGLILLFALMIFVTYNDIIKLIGCNG